MIERFEQLQRLFHEAAQRLREGEARPRNASASASASTPAWQRCHCPSFVEAMPGLVTQLLAKARFR